MGLFTKSKTLVSTGLFKGFTDYHSHILPGVDDGIRTMKDSLDVLAYFEQLGVESVWLTPHIMEDIPNTPAHLKEVFATLQAEYHGSIALHLAAEHMMDSLFEERLAAGDVLPLGLTEDRILVETSYFNPPFNMDDILSRVRSAGFFPVLAHPERYVYMNNARYEQLHKEGVEFQLNVASLSGAYGRDAQKKAQWLLKHNMYNYKGTDIHSLKMFAERINTKAKFEL